jgi:hypothetical protein
MSFSLVVGIALVLTLEKANIYFKKMEARVAGEIGDREWRLHEALKAKAKK